MLDDYQLLAREQLICGAQVHVGVPDRDEAVAVAQRVAPALPVLLALSASSPYWMGEDSGYASVRSLVWMRWPTAGDPGVLRSAAEHDALVADLITSGTISDPKMVYFDVRPSAHLPTVELAGHRFEPGRGHGGAAGRTVPGAGAAAPQEHRAGAPVRQCVRRCIERRCGGPRGPGLEGDLLDLPRSPAPVPAAAAVRALVGELRPQLEELGDWEQVFDLSVRALSRGSSAARQRRALARRGRISDVVDLVVRTPAAGRPGSAARAERYRCGGPFPYAGNGDEAFPAR
jgi:carboxylate-amine ligase